MGGSSLPPELWLQDEREVKRQRRKQSNRESARRSRLRKQAECEELATRVAALDDDNGALKNELVQLSEQCGRLEAHNALLQEQLTDLNRTEQPDILPEAVRGPDLEKAAAEGPEAGSVEV